MQVLFIDDCLTLELRLALSSFIFLFGFHSCPGDRFSFDFFDFFSNFLFLICISFEITRCSNPILCNKKRILAARYRHFSEESGFVYFVSLPRKLMTGLNSFIAFSGYCCLNNCMHHLLHPVDNIRLECSRPS